MRDAIERLRQVVTRIPHVPTQPQPILEILAFTPLGPVVAVRRPRRCRQVYFDELGDSRGRRGSRGYPPPHAQ